MVSGDEARFSYLLQPIRDLAENWDIDVATGLEDYLEELESITITLDGGQTNLNFAEAALLIQGSTCIYSRKVEYLYSLVLQTLEALSSGKYNQNAKSKEGGEDGGKAMEEDDGEDDFTLGLLEHLLEEAKNIDLDEEEEEDASCLAGESTLRGPTIFIAVDQNDTGIAFKMSSCAIHKSGALLVDGGQSLCSNSELEKSLGGGALSKEGIWFEGTFGKMEDSTLSNEKSDDDDDSDGPSFEVDGPVKSKVKEEGTALAENLRGVGNDVAPMTPGMAPMTPGFDPSHSGTVKKEEEASAGANPEEQGNTFASSIWDQLDPHDKGKFKPRPFKKGKVTMNIPDDMVPDEEDIWTVNDFDSSSVKLSGLAFKEFRYIQAQEKKRKALLRRQLKRQAAQFAVMGDVNDKSYFSEEENDFGGGGDDFDPHGGDSDDDTQHPLDFDDSQMNFPPMALDEAFGGMGQTYEDLCRSHIETFMSGVDQYAAEGDLSRRVNEWQERLAPVLLEQETRPAFDIHLYGSNILKCLSTSAPEKVQQSLKEQKHSEIDQALAKNEVLLSFADVVAGREQHEICRMFLASLQLANNGNLQLIHGQNAEEQDDRKFGLRLKSMKAAYELLDYEAPSVSQKN